MFTTETARIAGRKGGKKTAKLSACYCPTCGHWLDGAEKKMLGIESVMDSIKSKGGTARAEKYSFEERSYQVKNGKRPCGRPRRLPDGDNA